MSAGAGVEDVEVDGEALQELQDGRRRRQERTKTNMASGGIVVIFTCWDVTQAHSKIFTVFHFLKSLFSAGSVKK